MGAVGAGGADGREPGGTGSWGQECQLAVAGGGGVGGW